MTAVVIKDGENAILARFQSEAAATRIIARDYPAGTVWHVLDPMPPVVPGYVALKWKDDAPFFEAIYLPTDDADTISGDGE